MRILEPSCRVGLRRARLLASAALIGAALAGPVQAAGCDPKEKTPGVTATEIKLGALMPLSGSAAAGGIGASAGAKAYFDILNDAGGIKGHKIAYTVLDDQYTPSVAQQQIRTLIQRLESFSETVTTCPVTSLRPAVSAYPSEVRIVFFSFVEPGASCLPSWATWVCRDATVAACLATRWLPSCTTCTRSRVPGRRSEPCEVAALTPNSRPAATPITGTAYAHRLRGRHMSHRHSGRRAPAAHRR